MEQSKRTKLGAETLRTKRLKNLTVDAAKCAKMFAGGAAVASTSSATAMIQQVEGEDSSSGQERSSQRCC